MMDRFETHFDAFCAYFTTETVHPFLNTFGQFENLGFVIMSTRENIRLIARAPFPNEISKEANLTLMISRSRSN